MGWGVLDSITWWELHTVLEQVTGFRPVTRTTQPSAHFIPPISVLAEKGIWLIREGNGSRNRELSSIFPNVLDKKNHLYML